MKRLKFGVVPSFSKERLPVDEWPHAVQKIENLGYSTVFQQDHFDTTAYDPIAILASAASVTKTLNIGSFVFAVDFRHPVVLAKAAATLHLLSSGRFEFGIGAGYQPYDYTMSGIPLDPAGIRVERLEEALNIITRMWTQDRTSYSGKHFQVKEIEKAGELPEGEYPKIMIGAGGRKMLRLAAQYADIVNIIPRWRGSWGNHIRYQTIDRIKRKVSHVKEAAQDFGRDPDNIEFQLLVVWNEIMDDPERRISDLINSHGVSSDEIENSELVHFGSSASLIDKIKRLREETGVNYFVFSIRGDQYEEYAKSVVQPLTR